MDLGQVTSDYVNLSPWQGQTNSSRLLFHSQETNKLGNDHQGAAIQWLEDRNEELQEQVRDLSHQILVLKNTIDLLVTGQNGHTAMLEIHQLPMQRQFEVQDYAPTPNGIPVDPDPTPDCVFSPHPPILLEAMNEWQWYMVFNMAAFQGSPMANNQSHSPKSDISDQAGPSGRFMEELQQDL